MCLERLNEESTYTYLWLSLVWLLPASLFTLVCLNPCVSFFHCLGLFLYWCSISILGSVHCGLYFCCYYLNKHSAYGSYFPSLGSSVLQILWAWSLHLMRIDLHNILISLTDVKKVRFPSSGFFTVTGLKVTIGSPQEYDSIRAL